MVVRSLIALIQNLAFSIAAGPDASPSEQVAPIADNVQRNGAHHQHNARYQ